MTRDDYREKCFDVMEAAFLSGFYVKVVSPTIRNHVRQNIIKSFDALHGIVRAIEANEYDEGEYANPSIMCGDLTNPPEKKL